MDKEQARILILGASAQDQEFCASALPDYQLIFVPNLDRAVQTVQSEPVHLALIYAHPDVGEQGHLDILQRLNHSSAQKTASIMVVREGSEKVIVRALQEGLSDYLTHQELMPSILNMVISRAIENKKWETLCKKMARGSPSDFFKDEHTELYNRSYFETRYREEMKRSDRYQYSLTLVLVTIDELAEINRQYGLKAARQLMKELGQVIEIDLRSSDLVALVESDRLGILLPHTSLLQAETIWHRLSKNISAHPFSIEGTNYYVRVRAAMVALNREMEEIDAVLHRLGQGMDKLDEENQLWLCEDVN